MQKICGKCGEEKDMDMFRGYRNSEAKRGSCRECENEKSLRYGAAHREEIRQTSRNRRQWLKVNDPVLLRYKKLQSHRCGKKRVSKAKLLFTAESFRKWITAIPEQCDYCHKPLDIYTFNRDFTIDRKNNAGDYTPENCCIACNRCNLCKSHFFTYEQMKEIAAKYFINSA